MTQQTRPRLWRKKNPVRDTVQTAVFVLALVTLVNLATARAVVDGPSMEPTLYTGEFLMISRLHYLFGEVNHGDLVVFYPPGEDIRLLKRVIGLPGDEISISNQQVYRNGEVLDEPYFMNGPCSSYKCPDRAWTLGENEYFMMGDNRNRSRDSRVFGPVPKDNIIGRAVFRYLPPQRLKVFTAPDDTP